MRLIDEDDLREEIESLSMTVTGLRAGKGVLTEFMKQYRDSVLRIIDEQPAVDAVEVVRCRDCKYRVLDWQGNSYFCSHPNGLAGTMDGTRYCDCGERRTDG